MRYAFVFLGLGVFALTGCSPQWYEENANKEVYALLEEKRKPLVPEERRKIAFNARQELLALDAVGGPGELDDFRRTPPPEPEEVTVDIDALFEEAGVGVDQEVEDLEEAVEESVEEVVGPGEGAAQESETSPESGTPEEPSEGEIPEGATPEDTVPEDTIPEDTIPENTPLEGAEVERPGDPAPGDASGEAPVVEQKPEGVPESAGGDAASTGFPAQPDPAVEGGGTAPSPPGVTESDVGGGQARTEPGLEEDQGTREAENDTRAAERRAEEADTVEEFARYTNQALSNLTARTPKIPARVLSLEDALQLAFANNRDYQSQKEAVYLAALSLTLARWQFAPRFFGIVTGDWNTDADGSESGQVRSSFGFTKLFASGARLSISVLNNFFQFFTGDRREVANTILEGSLTQPLLRGFGSRIVLEPLTQSERDVVYELRAFERFRKTFAFEVISEYYRVVENVITVRNAYLNWQAQVDNLERSEALAEAERLPRLEVDQARQAELQAHNSWISAVTSYENSLDRFKITLGLSIETRIALDANELTKLGEESIQELTISVDDAVELAFVHRLDLQTASDQVDDAGRKVVVAADALRAQLDVTSFASLESGDGDAQTPLKFNTANFAYGIGLDLDLPLDRKAERNAYVQRLIAYDRELRTYTLFEDNISLTVRNEYRILEQEIIRYAIQKASLELNEFRVASTTALRDAGRSTTRDVNDSLDDLNDARNSLTSALVNYTLARLALFRDLGVLQVRIDHRVIEPDLPALLALAREKDQEDRSSSADGEDGSALVSARRKKVSAVAQ